MSIVFGSATLCRHCKGSGKRLEKSCSACRGTGFTDGAVPVARRTDPETSHEAAASQTSAHVRASQQAILTVLRALGPMTDESIFAALRASEDAPMMSPSGARTRRSELVGLGFVEDSDMKERLPSGRYSIVWRAV